MIYKNLFDCVGNTPIVELSNYNLENKTKIYAKVEYFNPAGSVKDRIAKQMIDTAFLKKQLKEKDTIIEATSGNTGIGIACYGAIKKCKVIIVMPEGMSEERLILLKAYGAKIILTNKKLGVPGAIHKAYELLKESPNSFLLNQFENEENVNAHYLTTGPEIFNQMNQDIDYFVASIGTGGTITGVAKYLKEKNPKIQIVGVEPKGSPFLSEGKVGKHHIQGIGSGFCPKILDLNLIDQIISISDEEAYKTANMLAKKEGMCVGMSSGATMAAAITLAKEHKNSKIVILFPDSGERYLSTSLFKEEESK